MKGLIIKDLLQLKTYRKTLILFIFVFVVSGMQQETMDSAMSMITIMLILVFGMVGIGTFSYDEMAKADRYILTLPLTRKEVVRAKYVLVILLTLIGAVVGVLASGIISYVMSKELPDFLELISYALGGILGIAFVEGIQIPCIYKFGAEKGRIQIFIVIAIMAFLLGGIFYIGEKININLPVNNILNILTNYMPLVLLTATVIIYFVSYKIAYKLYSKKEI